LLLSVVEGVKAVNVVPHEYTRGASLFGILRSCVSRDVFEAHSGYCVFLIVLVGLTPSNSAIEPVDILNDALGLHACETYIELIRVVRVVAIVEDWYKLCHLVFEVSKHRNDFSGPSGTSFGAS